MVLESSLLRRPNWIQVQPTLTWIECLQDPTVTTILHSCLTTANNKVYDGDGDYDGTNANLLTWSDFDLHPVL